MWGNLPGWIVSALMLAGAGIMLYAMSLPPQESAPAGLVPLAFKPVVLPVSADTVAPAGLKDCDAGDLYHQAIDEFLRNRKLYENGHAAQVDASQLPALPLMLQAADCAHMHLFELNPKQAINYDNKKPWIEALMALGQATDDAGLRYKEDNPKEAEKYYRAAFNLGRKMFEERLTWDELNRGLSIMTMSSEAMTKLADNAKYGKRVDELQHFSVQVQQYHTDLQEKVASPIGNPVESYGSKYAGDIFSVAKNPAVDHVWRVEAILHLGHYRWNVADDRKGDQLWASKELDKLDKSIDPKNQDIGTKTAVQAAKALTEEQQRMTGGGS
jgi:hypothetical protein